jgi:hypothetical protein
VLPPTVKPASEVSVVRRPQVDCNPPQAEKLRRGKGAGRNHSFFGEACRSLECGSLLPLSRSFALTSRRSIGNPYRCFYRWPGREAMILFLFGQPFPLGGLPSKD